MPSEGARNLWIQSKAYGVFGGFVEEELPKNHITGQKVCYRINSGAEMRFNIEPDFSPRLYRTVTFSAWIKYENVVQGANSFNKFNVFKHNFTYRNSETESISGIDYTTLVSYTGTSDWKYVHFTVDYSARTGYDQLKGSLAFNLENTKSGTAWVTGIKIELGSIPSDYTPAPEDYGWSTTAPVPTQSNRYLWKFEYIYYSDGSVEVTDPVNLSIAGADADTTGVTDAINKNNQAVAEAKQQLTTVADDLSKAKADLQNAVSAVDTKATNLKSDLSQAKQDLTSQAQQLQAQTSAQSELTKRVSSVEETANGTKTTVSELSKTVDQNSKNITSVTARTKVVEDDLSGTKTMLSQVKTTADSTSQKTATLETGLNGLSAKFDNLKIGGTNLLLYSADPWQAPQNGYYQFFGAAKTSETYNGAVVYKTGTVWSRLGINLNNHLVERGLIKVGDVLTYSVLAKTDQETPIQSRLFVRYDNQSFTENINGKAETINLTNEWQKVSVTFTVTEKMLSENNRVNYLGWEQTTDSESGKFVYYTCNKIERGNVATDYSPNDADLEQKVAEYKQNADQNYASLQTTVQNLDGTVQHNKTVADQTAQGFTTRIESLETYKDGESERASQYFEASKTETAKQLTAERTAIAKDYVAKSTYTSDVTGIRNDLSATTTTANTTKTNLANYQASNDRAVANLQSNLQTANGNISSLKTKVEAVPGQITSAVSAVEGKIPKSVDTVNLIKDTDKPFTMGYGITNTTWDNDKKCAYLDLTDPNVSTAKASEIVPQGQLYNFKPTKGMTYTQSILIDTDATFNPNGQPKNSWYTSQGHNQKRGYFEQLSETTYRFWSTCTWQLEDIALRAFDWYGLHTVLDFRNSGTYLAFYKPKLTTGTLPSDWSPSPEDVEGKIPTSVGGRNYIKNSEYRKANIYVNDNQVQDETFNISSAFWQNSNVYAKKIKLSFYYQPSVAYGTERKFPVYFKKSPYPLIGEVTYPANTTRLIKYTIAMTNTLPANFTADQIFIRFNGNLDKGRYHNIGKVMLEVSDVFSDWQPAPEDAIEEISSLSSELKQTKDGITLLATKTELSTAKNELQSGINTATNKANSAQSTANSNAQIINTHTTQISALNTGLSAKVSQTDFNALSGRVTSAENNITAKANELSSKITSVEGKIPSGEMNLVEYGRPADGYSPYAGAEYATHPFYYNGAFKMYIIKNAATSEKTFGLNRFKVERNTEYTLYFKGFTNGSVTNMDVCFLKRVNGSTNYYDSAQILVNARKLSTGAAEIVSVTFNTGNYDEGFLRFDNNGSRAAGERADLYFGDVSVKKGKSNNGWSPSLAELASSQDLKTAQSEFKQTTDAIKASVQSLDNSTVKSSSLTINADGIVMKAGKSTTDVANAIGSYFAVNQNAINLFSDKINVKGSMIVDGAITSNKIAAGAITADKIAANSISSDKIVSSGITADVISGGVLKAANDAMQINLNSSNITFSEDASVIFTSSDNALKRVITGKPSQFFKMCDSVFVSEIGELPDSTITVIGSNSDRTENIDSAGFGGVKIWNGSSSTDSTSFVELVGNRVAIYGNKNRSPWLFDMTTTTSSLIPQNSNGIKHSLGRSDRPFHEVHANDVYIQGERVAMMLKDIALHIGYKGNNGWVDRIG